MKSNILSAWFELLLKGIGQGCESQKGLPLSSDVTITFLQLQDLREKIYLLQLASIRYICTKTFLDAKLNICTKQHSTEWH